MSPRVVVIGDAMLDVVVRPEEPVAATSDTRSRVRISRGGSAANLSVALAPHHEVVYVGVVGDDVAGEMFIRDLEKSGVAANLEVARGSTGVVVAVVDSGGQRAMMTDRGVNSLLAMDAVNDALARPFDHLHVSGYTILDDATRHVASAALDAARVKGASTSVDACSVGPLEKLGAAQFLKASGRVSMLFANEEEALLLSGAADVERASSALLDASDEVLVTRGKNGAIAVRDGRVWTQPSLHVEVVDTTGAGDAATGAYLGARLEGRSQVESLHAAMAAAAVVVRGLGSRG